MKKLGSIFSVIADILGLIGFGLALFIMFWAFPNKDNLTFDYQAILIGILAGIFTLIVGWNIYQMVDWRNELEKVSEIKNEMDSKIRNIENVVNGKSAQIDKELNKLKTEIDTELNKLKTENEYQTYIHYYAISDIYASLAGGKIINDVNYEFLKFRTEALCYTCSLKEWDLCKSITKSMTYFFKRKSPKLSESQRKDLIAILIDIDGKEFADEISDLIVELKK